MLRSFDERHHNYLGYALRLTGDIGDEHRDFTIGVGEGAHAENGFRVGDDVSGEAVSVANARMEPVEYYRVSELKLGERGPEKSPAPPPWHGVPPELPIYRQRGHRRLSARTYDTRCWECIWGCRMPVEMIIDQWKPDVRQYRYETFCYGPLSCAWYSAGPCRVVPGRKGMRWTEEDWVDEGAVSHRGPDE